ncbi:hypothetical protein FQR65_LT09871 [Abscondita terminalis]|nr:hypothetical protein FQR65_LT09871 [Abscondita terminalis]
MMKSSPIILTLFINILVLSTSSNLNKCIDKVKPNSDNKENPRILFDIRTQMKTPPSYITYNHNYVIRADSYEDLLHAFYALSISALWKNKLTREGKFLLVTFDENLKKKVTLFWEHGMIDLIVLVYKSDDTIDFFTADPQNPTNECGRVLNQVLSIGHCFGSTPIRLPKVLRKYTNCNVTYLTSITKRYSSIKLFASIGFVLDLLVERLGVSLKTINVLNTNYSYDLFSIFMQDPSSFDQNVYTSTFFSDSLVLIVPFPLRIPDMETMGMVFKNNVWILILISFVATSSIWLLITRVLKNNWAIAKSFLEVFSITLFGSVNKVEVFRSTRCLFLAYVLYSIHIQTAFTSKLIGVLTLSQYEPTIKTLNELSKSNLKILVSTSIYNQYFEHETLNSSLYNKITEKFDVHSIEDFSKAITDLKTFRNSAALVTSNEVDILTAVFLIDFNTIEGSALVPNIERVVGGLPGSYIIKTIDKMLSNLVESGILNYFLNNVKYEIHIKRNKSYSKNVVLSLQHVYVVFVFWFVGLCLSAAVMVSELILARIMKERI